MKESRANLDLASRQGDTVCFSSTDRSLSGLIYCGCSPTSGTGSKDAKELLDAKSAEVTTFWREEEAKGEYSSEVILATASELLVKGLEECYEKFGVAECIDADASGRVLGETMSGSLYCIWNIKTGRNLGVQSLLDGPCGWEMTLVELDTCPDSSRSTSSGTTTSGGETSTSTTDSSSEIGESGGDSSEKDTTDSSNETENESGEGLSEGCVDARVLPSCRRIHARDMTADVLCAHGLCATPNHELVIDGTRTSMRVLCAKSVCSEARMPVNTCYYRDLKGDGQFVHAASGIGVTSWDVRFPRFASMLVQDAMIMLRAAAAYFYDGTHSEL